MWLWIKLRNVQRNFFMTRGMCIFLSRTNKVALSLLKFLTQYRNSLQKTGSLPHRGSLLQFKHSQTKACSIPYRDTYTEDSSSQSTNWTMVTLKTHPKSLPPACSLKTFAQLSPWVSGCHPSAFKTESFWASQLIV